MRINTSTATLARTRAVALLTAISGALLVVALTPGTADAAVRASTGEVCTIVGTKGRDVIRGTARRDVICGRGGNDVINGRGGNDVLDGGTGKDELTGSSGNDVLLGGAGRDRLVGSAGNDRLAGGSGGDILSASTGDDRADGGTGNDVVDGATGNDRVTGGDGNDDVDGGAGADRVAGGPGADDGDGGPGSDVVLGETGDDVLGGGSGQDSVDGGPGFNLCDTPSDTDDRQVRCAIDTEAPVLRGISLSRTTVDVTRSAQTVTVRAHVVDDTGVAEVMIDNRLSRLVSGTARNGIWSWTITVPAHYRPGAQEVTAVPRDRVGRTGATTSSVYTVVNTAPDRAMPVVRSVTLDRKTVDTRREMQWMTATVRITDDLAGPSDDVLVCLSHAFSTGSPSFRQAGGCSLLSKLSGTRRDSTWRGSLLLPEDSDDGTWNADLRVTDASGARGTETWYGTNSFAALKGSDPTARALPEGAGVFRVIGAAPDTRAPRLTSVRMSPSTVSTTNGAKLVTVEVAATDAEGITNAGFYVGGYSDRGGPDDYLQIASIYGLDLVGGTRTNGLWRGTFVVPGGTPNGRYAIEARLEDRAHVESWTPDGHGWGQDHTLDSTTAPTGAHLVVADVP